MYVCRGVDLFLTGHVHYAQVTCAIYNSTCISTNQNQNEPNYEINSNSKANSKSKSNSESKSNSNSNSNSKFQGTVHALIGNGGFVLQKVPSPLPSWSVFSMSQWGYATLSEGESVTESELVLRFFAAASDKPVFVHTFNV